VVQAIVRNDGQILTNACAAAGPIGHAGRNVCPQRPRNFGQVGNRMVQAPEPVEEAQRSRSISRTAADTRCNGQAFFQVQPCAPLYLRDLGQPPGSPRHQIVGLVQPVRKGAADRQFQAGAGPGRNLVALVEKGKYRFDLVIAIGQPFAHMEGQVDFCPGGFAVRRAPNEIGHQGETSSGRRPRSILLARRSTFSPSANSLADFHA